MKDAELGYVKDTNALKIGDGQNTLENCTQINQVPQDVMQEIQRLGSEMYRLCANYDDIGQFCEYQDETHAAAISHDNTYSYYVDGTTPAIVIDSTIYPVMRRSQFDYKTTVNLNNIIAGIYWINGYSETITGDTPFTGQHYLLISTGVLNNRFQCAISASTSHTIKTRYYVSDVWTDWV